MKVRIGRRTEYIDKHPTIPDLGVYLPLPSEQTLNKGLSSYLNDVFL